MGDSPIDRVLEKLDAVHKSGEGWTARCPGHEDKRNSLSINLGDDNRVLLRCFAGCSVEFIVQKLGLQMTDLFKPKQAEKKSKFNIVAIYDYRDANNVLLFQSVRLDPKDFRQRRPDGKDGWIWSLNGTRRVLYRLPELLAADPLETVFIVEGEKDADNLIVLGLLATTNAQGAGKWRDEYNGPLRDREVIILPDNDLPGREHARKVANILIGCAASIKIVELPNLPPKGDVSDWLAAGGTAEQLRELCSQAPVFEPENDDKSKVPQQLITFPQSDEGNAEAFAFLYSDRVRFDRLRGEFRIWDSKRWAKDATGEVERLATETVRLRQAAFALYVDEKAERKMSVDFAQRSENRGKQHGLLEAIQHIEPIADAGLNWDSDDWLLVCSNGVLDLRLGQLREGKTEDRITLCANVPYDPNARADRWFDFLKEVFVEDDLIEFIQRAVGYSLTGDTSEQVLFLCYGRGANGKSVFLETISRILGEYAANKRFSTFEDADRGGGSQATPDIANLVGKRLLTASETRDGARLNEARIKSLTGCDPITGRHLYARDEITFRPKAKIWLSTNHKPRVTDDSFGFWRRIRLVPFTQTFREDKANRRLTDTLAIEADGILAWAVRGCAKWQDQGLNAPPQVKTATEEYQRESDPLAIFLDERCATSPDAQCTAADLYAAYRDHCDRYRERRPMGANAFGQRLVERGFSKERPGGRGKIVYRGIGLVQQ